MRIEFVDASLRVAPGAGKIEPAINPCQALRTMLSFGERRRAALLPGDAASRRPAVLAQVKQHAIAPMRRRQNQQKDGQSQSEEIESQPNTPLTRMRFA